MPACSFAFENHHCKMPAVLWFSVSSMHNQANSPTAWFQPCQQCICLCAPVLVVVNVNKQCFCNQIMHAVMQCLSSNHCAMHHRWLRAELSGRMTCHAMKLCMSALLWRSTMTADLMGRVQLLPMTGWRQKLSPHTTR